MPLYHDYEHRNEAMNTSAETEQQRDAEACGRSHAAPHLTGEIILHDVTGIGRGAARLQNLQACARTAAPSTTEEDFM